ncbi:hypothetical protein Hanom_Chr16g01482581 [Helianthus anomalus]
MDREDKPVYMEDDKVVSLYVVAFEREGGNMATVPKRVDEEIWYLQIIKNFILPRDEDFGELSNLGIGPEKKKRAPAGTVAPKKNYATKAQSSRAKKVQGKKKGMHHSSDSWCDYVAVSDSLEGLAPVVVKKPKVEPRDAADVPVSTPMIPSIWNQVRSPSKKVKRRKIVDPETTGADAPLPKSPEVVTRDLEKGKFVAEDPVITITSAPVNVEENPAGDKGASSYDEDNDPLRPYETLGIITTELIQRRRHLKFIPRFEI